MVGSALSRRKKVFLLLLLVSALRYFWNRIHRKEDSEAILRASLDRIERLSKNVTSYGVDISFPIHHSSVSTNYAWLPHNLDPSIEIPREYRGMMVNPLGDRQSFYNEFIASCRKPLGAVKGLLCLSTEQDRIKSILDQPQSMQNYTEIGYKKIKAPKELFTLLNTFWERNKDKAKPELWGPGNTFTNNWESPSEMVSFEDTALRGGGERLKSKIWDISKQIISEWTGQELTPTSLYGIRIYNKGAILAPHVDRLPLVSSAIINVAQDVDEPWPLEVYGHDGRAENVTMEPGDMVLYESHSVVHGRPFRLNGRFMANVFVHFEPTGHSLRHNMKLEEEARGDVNAKYKASLEQGSGGHESDNHALPVYIKADSPEAKRWFRDHPASVKAKPKSAHYAAQVGDVKGLIETIKKKKDVVNSKDENGWTPLHEGARGGHLEIVKTLIENGADISAKTGDGGTVLWWAKESLGDDNEVVKFLEDLGALAIGPEL